MPIFWFSWFFVVRVPYEGALLLMTVAHAVRVQPNGSSHGQPESLATPGQTCRQKPFKTNICHLIWGMLFVASEPLLTTVPGTVAPSATRYLSLLLTKLTFLPPPLPRPSKSWVGCRYTKSNMSATMACFNILNCHEIAECDSECSLPVPVILYHTPEFRSYRSVEGESIKFLWSGIQMFVFCRIYRLLLINIFSS